MRRGVLCVTTLTAAWLDALTLVASAAMLGPHNAFAVGLPRQAQHFACLEGIHVVDVSQHHRPDASIAVEAFP